MTIGFLFLSAFTFLLPVMCSLCNAGCRRSFPGTFTYIYIYTLTLTYSLTLTHSLTHTGCLSSLLIGPLISRKEKSRNRLVPIAFRDLVAAHKHGLPLMRCTEEYSERTLLL